MAFSGNVSICKNSVSKIPHEETDPVYRLTMNSIPYVKAVGHDTDDCFVVKFMLLNLHSCIMHDLNIYIYVKP